MATKGISLVFLAMLALPAFAQGTRYYGVDNHSSFASSCQVAPENYNNSNEKVYQIHGDQCGDASANFSVLFITGKVAVEPDQDLRNQEDAWLGKTLARLSEPGLTETTSSGPKDTYFAGTPERAEWEQFTGDGVKALMAVYADATVPGTIYVTGWAIVRPISDPQELQTTAAVDEFMGTIQIGSQ